MSATKSRLLLINLIFFLASCNQMPYHLQIAKFGNRYQINDKDDYPIISEGFPIHDDLPNIKKLIQYSENQLGIVIMVLLENKAIYYVAIKPKPEQSYAELDVTYTLYSGQDYKKLKLRDKWYKIHI